MSDLGLDVFGRPVLFSQHQTEMAEEKIHPLLSEEIIDRYHREDLHRKDARDLANVELSETETDARWARMNDIVDIISASDDRRMVRLVPQRGFVKREIGYLSDDEVCHVVHRLRRLGVEESVVESAVINRVPEDRRDGIIARIG